MNRKWTRTALAVGLVWASVQEVALAADVVVGAGGSIQGAIIAASDGDRILVQPGTYFEVLDLQGKRLQVVGVAGALATVVDGSGLGDAVVRVEGCPEGTLLRGLTLTHGAGRPFPSSYGFDYYGGAVWAGGGSKLAIEDCRLIDNGWGTGTFAGGVYSGGENTEVAISRSVIARNRAWASGGATLCDYYGEMTLDQCTVWGNSSDNFFGHQGGVSVANWGKVWVVNSILWANDGAQAGAFGSPYNVGTEIHISYSDVQGGYAGAGNFGSDPQVANPSVDDYSLLPGSPCIDAGDPGQAVDCDGSVLDVGADVPVCVDCDGNGVDDGFDLSAGGNDVDADGYLDACEPSVIAITPPASAWHTATTLTFDGSGFDAGTSVEVQIGSASSLWATYVSPTRITVDVPAGHVPDAGPVDVRLVGVGFDTTVESGWTCLPALKSKVIGDTQGGGQLELSIDAAYPGEAAFWVSYDASPVGLPFPEVHSEFWLPTTQAVFLGNGFLSSDPSYVRPFTAGAMPAGVTVRIQGLAREFGPGDLWSFTQVLTVSAQ
jgi:hypothetical protein